MRKRVTCLRSAGAKTSSALDDPAATQGLSFCPRGPVALVAAIALLVLALGLAACGGEGEDQGEATATATGTAGLELPPDLTQEQKDAVLQIKDLSDGAEEPLATLVSHKELTEDEVRAAIEDDPEFLKLEALAEDAGFGPASAGVELQYDNDVTVTAAVLDSPEGGLALAMRETGSSAAYIVVHLASDGKTVTEYNNEGTVTLDVDTLEGSAMDSPDAQHSCRVGHCIFAALTWLYDSWYGWVVGELCQACMESVVALPATAGASAVLSIPSCMTCIPGLVAAGVSSTIVCYDAPCSYCTDDTCGEPPRSHEEYCAWWIVDVDPTTGISAAVAGADTGYYCDGITQNWDGSDDLSESECRFNSESTGIVRACPYGCADPPAGDTRSRDCAPPSTCDPVTCSGEQPTGEPYCVARAAPYNAVIKQDYEVRECVPAIYPGGSNCQTSVEDREVEECAFGCSVEGTSCAEPTQTTSCDPAMCDGDKPKGNPVCTANPGGLTGQVTQQRERCSCQTVQGVSACVCVPIPPTIIPCALGCADDGRSCAGPGGSRGEGCDPSACEQPDVPLSDPRCVFRPDDQQWIVERDYDHWECSPVQGGDDATCVEMTITKLEEACPNGCAPDGASCAEAPTHQIAGKVMVAMSPDLYAQCMDCTIRLSGSGGTFTATSSSSDATFVMSDVPAGSYRVQRQCGGQWVDAHGPYDDTSLGYPNLTVPSSANPAVLVGPCDDDR